MLVLTHYTGVRDASQYVAGEGDLMADRLKSGLWAGDRVRLYAQTTAPDGGLAWHRPLGPDPVSEAEADAYIRRSLDFDPDLWALEILDRDGGFALDGRVLD